MAITGDGSQEYPFIVESWADAVEAAPKIAFSGTVYIKFRDGVVEDLSVSYPNSTYVPSIAAPHKINIDFNNATFINGRFNYVLYRSDRISSGASAYINFNINRLVMINCYIQNSFIGGAGGYSYKLGMDLYDSVLDIYTASTTALFMLEYYSKGYRLIYRSKLTIHGEGQIGNGVTFYDSMVDIDGVASIDNISFEYGVTDDPETLLDSGSIQLYQKGNREGSESSYPIYDSNLRFIDSYVCGRIRAKNENCKSVLACASRRSIFEIDCDFLLLYHALDNNLNNSDKAFSPKDFEIGNLFVKGTMYTYSDVLVTPKTTSELRDPSVLYENGFSIKP